MKPLLLFIALFLSSVNSIFAQTLEHFEIEKNKNSCWLTPKFDSLPEARLNGTYLDVKNTIPQMMRNLVLVFPEAIQEILKQPGQEVWVDLRFNAKGEIFCMLFFVSKTSDPSFLTNAQWLEIYHAIQFQKLDISKLELSEHFEWSACGPMSISRFLREAEQKK